MPPAMVAQLYPPSSLGLHKGTEPGGCHTQRVLPARLGETGAQTAEEQYKAGGGYLV